MRRSIDDAVVPEAPTEDPTPAVCWSVGISDDYEDSEPRVTLTVEEQGAPGTGIVVHLNGDGARRLRLALASALVEVGMDRGR
ncbi:MAG: hypothetical protein FJW94_05395 [Actinobacteria bacterium]|nr:hypothetical protein [Actinomycetota bacterium]